MTFSSYIAEKKMIMLFQVLKKNSSSKITKFKVWFLDVDSFLKQKEPNLTELGFVSITWGCLDDPFSSLVLGSMQVTC